jgi:Transport and Golgi organisation 2
MCTLSFLPTANGFRVAMNRDEKRIRIRAMPPERFALGNRVALYPREPGGGTWLAINDAGLCLALINWYRIEKEEPREKTESRGQVIPQLIGETGPAGLKRKLRDLPLQNLRPFRLIAIDRRSRRITEWRWNTRLLTSHRLVWRLRHWFSSGYDEVTAEKSRAEICRLWSLGKAGRLRQLHATHLPAPGPFSICMHRSDAATVSYSEVAVTGHRITFRYLAGSPCQKFRMSSSPARTLAAIPRSSQ